MLVDQNQAPTKIGSQLAPRIGHPTQGKDDNPQP